MTTPTHRELLEGAARACGHTFKWVEVDGVEKLCVPYAAFPEYKWREWNSLHSMAELRAALAAQQSKGEA